MRRLATLAFAILAFGRCAGAGSPPDFEWHGYVAPDQQIEIRGINGSVRLQPSDSSIADVTATKSGKHPDPADIRIEVDFSDAGVMICAVYPASDGQEVNPCHPEQNHATSLNADARVDFVVRIPSRAAFKYRTVNGSVYADVPDNVIDAQSVDGRIVMKTGAPARAGVVNGSIIASLGSVDGCDCAFTTVNGTIDVSLPATVNAHVEATTVAGAITTDFPIPVKRTFVGSRLEGDIGIGGADITMSVVAGSVHLRKTSAE